MKTIKGKELKVLIEQRALQLFKEEHFKSSDYAGESDTDRISKLQITLSHLISNLIQNGVVDSEELRNNFESGGGFSTTNSMGGFTQSTV